MSLSIIHINDHNTLPSFFEESIAMDISSLLEFVDRASVSTMLSSSN